MGRRVEASKVTVVRREEPGRGAPEQGRPTESGAGHAPGARFVAGPGFEIAVRSGARSPFDLRLDGPRRPPSRPRRSPQEPADEFTLESIRDALQLLVDQVSAMEARMNLAIKSARDGRRAR